ncbi:hypothetical protein M3Y95_01280100 [Aphelenchoides besseyi]|nr:hypothetical protein M3Y95_01280100 [Aphelenchoides besseyi]
MANLSNFLESRFHIWGHEAEFIKQLHLINNISSYCLSPLTTVLLFYMILFKSPVMFQGYRVVLLFGMFIHLMVCDSFLVNGVDCSLIVVMWFMKFTRLDGGYFVYTTKWPTIPLTVQWINFSCFWFSIALESSTVMLEFWFRYVLIKTRKPPSSQHLFWMISFVICFSGISSFITMSYFFSNDVSKTTLTFVMFDAQNKWGGLILAYRRFVIFVSFGLTSLLATLSFRTLKRQSVSLSGKAKKMLNDFTKTLYLKSLGPIFMVLLPLLFRYAAQIYELENWIIDEAINMMYYWMPFINSTLTLLLLSHYRRVLIGAFERLRFKTNSIQTISSY